jgi:SAM-dependent methyltransferase
MNFHYDTQTYSTRSAECILPIVFELIDKPNSILDVGCGNGSWLKICEKLGISDYQGIDGEHIASNFFLANYNKFQAKDLSKPFDLGIKYDLVISLEVAEHLPPESADIFVENLTKHGDTILFSAALPFQGGYKHLNEQYPTYWAEKFIRKGYQFYDLIRPKIWNDQSIKVWYRQNIFLVGNDFSVLTQRFKPTQVLNLIHPELFEQKAIQAQRAEQMEKGQLGIKIAFRSLMKALQNKLWNR